MVKLNKLAKSIGFCVKYHTYSFAANHYFFKFNHESIEWDAGSNYTKVDYFANGAKRIGEFFGKDTSKLDSILSQLNRR